jgi:hypothetical protein
MAGETLSHSVGGLKLGAKHGQLRFDSIGRSAGEQEREKGKAGALFRWSLIGARESPPWLAGMGLRR